MTGFLCLVSIYIDHLYQACEQLNAWLGGFQTILNKMTVDNFNWTLHTLLFLHTKKVIALQNTRETRKQASFTDDEEEDDDGMDMDTEYAEDV